MVKRKDATAESSFFDDSLFEAWPGCYSACWDSFEEPVGAQLGSDGNFPGCRSFPACGPFSADGLFPIDGSFLADGPFASRLFPTGALSPLEGSFLVRGSSPDVRPITTGKCFLVGAFLSVGGVLPEDESLSGRI